MQSSSKKGILVGRGQQRSGRKKEVRFGSPLQTSTSSRSPLQVENYSSVSPQAGPSSQPQYSISHNENASQRRRTSRRPRPHPDLNTAFRVVSNQPYFDATDPRTGEREPILRQSAVTNHLVPIKTTGQVPRLRLIPASPERPGYLRVPTGKPRRPVQLTDIRDRLQVPIPKPRRRRTKQRRIPQKEKIPISQIQHPPLRLPKLILTPPPPSSIIRNTTKSSQFWVPVKSDVPVSSKKAFRKKNLPQKRIFKPPRSIPDAAYKSVKVKNRARTKENKRLWINYMDDRNSKKSTKRRRFWVPIETDNQTQEQSAVPLVEATSLVPDTRTVTVNMDPSTKRGYKKRKAETKILLIPATPPKHLQILPEKPRRAPRLNDIRDRLQVPAPKKRQRKTKKSRNPRRETRVLAVDLNRDTAPLALATVPKLILTPPPQANNAAVPTILVTPATPERLQLPTGNVRRSLTDPRNSLQVPQPRRRNRRIAKGNQQPINVPTVIITSPTSAASIVIPNEEEEMVVQTPSTSSTGMLTIPNEEQEIVIQTPSSTSERILTLLDEEDDTAIRTPSSLPAKILAISDEEGERMILTPAASPGRILTIPNEEETVVVSFDVISPPSTSRRRRKPIEPGHRPVTRSMTRAGLALLVPGLP